MVLVQTEFCTCMGCTLARPCCLAVKLHLPCRALPEFRNVPQCPSLAKLTGCRAHFSQLPHNACRTCISRICLAHMTLCSEQIQHNIENWLLSCCGLQRGLPWRLQHPQQWPWSLCRHNAVGDAGHYGHCPCWTSQAQPAGPWCHCHSQAALEEGAAKGHCLSSSYRQAVWTGAAHHARWLGLFTCCPKSYTGLMPKHPSGQSLADPDA